MFRFLSLCAAGLIAGSALGGPASDIVLPEVKLENVSFKDSFSALRAILESRNFRVANDPVQDIPADFDNTRPFTLVRKNIPLNDLLTTFGQYYGLNWKQSGNTITFSLPRPRP